ncbi:MAG: hypothetical protein UY92_C0006G0020 [Candidatus Magasanikbacteria bacterium GW2011_GWA2_56_11]|uniref:Methyltransferase domain-containing protein n=1 Tax=Candidatus Magasanikbacteria bacterium GW2011_GWA2_56_11 TaxID=1619044 RepID=A0A0G2BAC6_9BACT|nr:MAG: hypothetical protein UY92_C0006G0020 [Candidatus Magasanikbacteria bacterium GW2011_GWA2_56_11]
MWDARPVIRGPRAAARDWLILLFYPKKFFLYLHIRKNFRRSRRGQNRTAFRILDVGCGTGASVIELKKIFGPAAEVHGVDVVRLQVDLAQSRLAEYGVSANVCWFDGERLPYPDQYFDAIHTSDVLGHVADVPAWLAELSRVARPGGALAMFSESRLGRHACIRRYLLRRGLNTDPHAAFHVSLYSKADLKLLLQQAGFGVKKMYTTVWAKFLVHPDELYPALAASRLFPVLRFANIILYKLKKAFHPVSTAAAELYTLAEMLTVGRILEAQGYVILAAKDKPPKS